MPSQRECRDGSLGRSLPLTLHAFTSCTPMSQKGYCATSRQAIKLSITMTINNKEPAIPGLTEKENKLLWNWIENAEAGEMAQVKDLLLNCHNKYQFAKTHSVYIKDWEATKARMIEKLENGILPRDTSAAFFETMIKATDVIMERKFAAVRHAFQMKFGESIYNFLGPDGKTKKLFGIFG